MPVCSEPKCVSLATNGAMCAPHAAGYRKHDSGAELRCGDCRGLIAKDQWYQKRGGAMFHVKPCKVHPEVAKEREAAAAIAKA